MAYTFLEDVAIADVAFEASGDDIAELFKSCAEATFEVMADLTTVGQDTEKKIRLENKKVDKLLYEFLEELIYLKDLDCLLFSDFDIKIKKEDGIYQLEATAYGSTINSEKQDLKADVKAVTLHMFEVKQTKDGWKARVVLDI